MRARNVFQDRITETTGATFACGSSRELRFAARRACSGNAICNAGEVIRKDDLARVMDLNGR